MRGKPVRFAIRDRVRSIGHAARGLHRLVVREHNAWVHLAATLAVAAAGTALRLPPASWTALVLAAGLVWVAEATNTAIETLCDRLHPGIDPAIGRVKDLAAGAVLAAAAAAALTGIFVFLPRLLERWP